MPDTADSRQRYTAISRFLSSKMSWTFRVKKVEFVKLQGLGVCASAIDP
jgi:hypothetical protein